MSTNSAQLLKLLSSGVRPVETALRGAAGAAQAAGSAAFADLLKQAQEGALASELPVTIAGDVEAAGVKLSEEQLARLALASDKLETAGVHTAMVSIDGQKLVLDVRARQVTGVAKSENGVVSGVDGVIDLGDLRAQNEPTSAGIALGSGTKAGVLPVPSGALAENPSVAKLLAELAKNASTGDEGGGAAGQEAQAA